MIYVSSDLHLGHNKPFLYEPRGFKSIEEHDEAIVKNWNDTVTDDDVVFILGDLMLNDNEHGMECLRQMKGHKIIVRGNHDTDTRVQLYSTLDNVEIAGYATQFRYNGVSLYLSHYASLTSNWDYDKPLKARVVNLCGHVHTQNKWHDWDKGLIYHVELDAHGNKPKLLDEIIQEIKEKMKEEVPLRYTFLIGGSE